MTKVTPAPVYHDLGHHVTHPNVVVSSGHVSSYTCPVSAPEPDTTCRLPSVQTLLPVSTVYTLNKPTQGTEVTTLEPPEHVAPSVAPGRDPVVTQTNMFCMISILKKLFLSFE